jgi:hypothetical protein
MTQEAEADSRREKRRRLVPIWVPLLFGLLSLSNMMTRPRFATFHGSDVVQLIGTGMCFGVALASLVALVRSRPT